MNTGSRGLRGLSRLTLIQEQLIINTKYILLFIISTCINSLCSFLEKNSHSTNLSESFTVISFKPLKNIW